MATITPDILVTMIENFTLGGRSLQVEIGVSEIGMSCQRCVARKMAEYEKSRKVSSFRTTVGRYFHEGVAADFGKVFVNGEMIIEDKLVVHRYKGWTLRGSCDVFLPNDGHGMVLDWKCVGDDTLTAMRKRFDNGELPKEQYVIQGQLYGLGWELAGHEVEDICIFFVPANKGDLRRYHVAFEFPYDRAAAAKALANVERMIDEAEVDGWDRVVRRRDPEFGCLSCPTYEAVDNPVYDLSFPESKRSTLKKVHSERIRRS